MGSKQLFLLSLTLALVAGLAMGCAKKEEAAGPGRQGPTVTAPSPPPAARAHPRPAAIIVGPKASDVDPWTKYLNSDDNEQAIWILVGQGHQLASGKKLYIEFENKEVFPDAEPQGDRFRVPCQGIVCQSGPIGEKAIHGKPGYKYWQIIEDANGQREEHDAMIIIDP